MSKLALELINSCLESLDPNLDLRNCKLTDEDFLSGHTIDIKLSQCTHLEIINLSNLWIEILENTTISRISITSIPKSIKKLTNLKKLDLSGNQITKIENLENLTSLETLDISDNIIAKIEGLEKLIDLKRLNLSSNQITKIEGLENQEKLKHLDLSMNNISKIEGLFNLSSLLELGISHNNILRLEGLNKLSSLKSIDIRNNEIQKIEGLTNQEDLEVLIISNNKITKIEGLEKLKELFYLDISFNEITIIEGLETIVNLSSLYISNNKIKKIEGINNLENLENLNISFNSISSITKLKNLKKLTHLDASDNLISEIKNLENLVSLEVLNCSDNNIEKIEGLDELKSLRNLDLNTNIISKIEGLNNLTNLIDLNLGNNRIEKIEGLEKFSELNSLSLSKNNINKIEGLINLNKITEVYLSYNNIEDLKGLETLSNLKKLYISNNKITNINGINKFVNIIELDISHNFIKDLSDLFLLLNHNNKFFISTEEFFSLENYEIRVSNNPIINPSIEIVKEGTKSIIRHFERLKKEKKVQVYEAKMILAGSGESGKTSLSLRLNDRNCVLPSKDNRTKEVVVNDYNFLTKEQNIFTAHIWDFGGQQIIHNFHRLFMNESTLYILITETSRENDDFDYWLQTLQLFGGDSPILFVQNKRNGIPRSLNIQPYKEYFNIKDELYNVNLLSNEGLDEVEKAIQYHIQQLPIVKRTVPISWLNLKNELVSINEPYISYDTFVNICKKQSITTRVDIEDVGTFLHNLGTILWYKNNPTLKEKIILEKHWGTKAIFQLIFNDEINNKQFGYFSLQQAQKIWDGESSYCHNTSNIIELMLEFKLAYKQKNKKDEFIIPALLKPEQPNKNFNTKEQVIIEYHYTHLPRGIVNQLAAELYFKIENDANTWSEGVWLKEGNTEAKVSENRFDKVLKIELEGHQHRELFGTIKNTITKIHSEYKGLKCELKIPCICNRCKTSIHDKHYFNYDDIIDRLEKGRKDTIECVKSGDDVYLNQLIAGILPIKENLKDKEVLQELSRIESRMNANFDKLKTNNLEIINLVKLSIEKQNLLAATLTKIDAEIFTLDESKEMLVSLETLINNELKGLPENILIKWKELNKKADDEVEIKGKLKTKIPIIPLILEYETEWSVDIKKLNKKIRGFIF